MAEMLYKQSKAFVARRRVYSSSGLAMALLLASAAQAQSGTPAAQNAAADASDGGDIIVTANRRAERLQDVPIAVNVLSRATLASTGVADTQYLASMVPGLSVTKNNSNQYFLRGVGTSSSTVNSEQSVASYLDGVYVYSTFGAVSLANMDRIEVLRGPQGTLFGRNTTGGVIQAVTRDPLAAPAIEASLGYGNYQTLTGSFYGNAHLAPTLGVSLSVDFRDQNDGFGRNSTRNEDVFFRNDLTARGKIAWEATETTKVTALFQYRHQRDSGLNWIPVAGTRGLDGVDGSAYGRYETRGNEPEFFRSDGYLGYLRLEQGLGDFATLTSISSYNKVRGQTSQDQDGTPLDFSVGFQKAGFRNISQELQLSSLGSGRFKWLLGAYYYRALAELTPARGTGTSGPRVERFRGQRTRSLAGFGQASYEILDGTTVTAGLRYTDEYQRLKSNSYTLVGSGVTQIRTPFPPNPLDPVDSSGWTWRLALDHKFSSDIMGYVSWNRGLKGGGFTLVTLATVPGYKPEKLDAYEAGLKMQFLNGRVRINPALFLYKFKNIQYNAIIQLAGQPQSARVANAAAATITGFDLDAALQVSGRLQLNAAFEYLHSKYDSFPKAVVSRPAVAPANGAVGGVLDAKGNRLPYAPRSSASLGFTYKVPVGSGEVILDGSTRYVGSQYVNPSNFLKIPSYTVVGLGLGWTSADERLGVRVWGDNIFDERYDFTVTETGVGFFRTPGAPRTYGVTVSTKF
jgi:iron complex outermembrane receptor protein